jgi:hypothetical protein
MATATTSRGTPKPQPKPDGTPNQLVAAPRRVTTTAKTATAAKTATKAAAKSSESGSSVGTVHPGSFCSHAGTPGLTDKGTTMVCRPGSDGKLRWGKA